MVVAGAPGARPVRVRDFVRLKLQLSHNTRRGQPRRALAFGLSVAVGVVLAGMGLLAGLASGAGSARLGFVVVTYLGAGLVFGWMVLPVLAFGVDETLDPATFVLLPLRRRILVPGLLAAGCAGVPAIATAVALCGLVPAGIRRAGPAGGAIALAGALLGLALCVVVSRAVSGWLAGMLRSRRLGDLTVVAVAVLAAALGPIEVVLTAALVHSGAEDRSDLARVLAWTPLGAPFAGPYDLADGRLLRAGARLALVALCIVGLAWWWGRATWWGRAAPSVAPSRSLLSRRRRARSRTPVGALLPAVLRRAARPFAAILAKELRYWWRDPRRRAGLITVAAGGVAVALAGGRSGGPGPAWQPSALAGLAAVMATALLTNQFGVDGAAFATEVLAGVAGRTELRARACALGVVLGPVLAAMALVVAGGAPGRAAVAAGGLAAGLGAAMGVVSMISVVAGSAVGRTGNAWAARSGTAAARVLLNVVGVGGSVVVAAPVVAVAAVLAPGWPAVMAVGGPAWGVAAAFAGTGLAGTVMQRRGVELLAMVSPSG